MSRHAATRGRNHGRPLPRDSCHSNTSSLYNEFHWLYTSCIACLLSLTLPADGPQGIVMHWIETCIEYMSVKVAISTTLPSLVLNLQLACFCCPTILVRAHCSFLRVWPEFTSMCSYMSQRSATPHHLHQCESHERGRCLWMAACHGVSSSSIFQSIPCTHPG